MAVLQLSLIALIYLISITLIWGQTEQAERTVYFAFFALCPFLVLLAYVVLKGNQSTSPKFRKAMVFHGGCLLAFEVIVLLFSEKINLRFFQIFSILHSIGAIWIYFSKPKRKNRISVLFTRILFISVPAISFLCIVFVTKIVRSETIIFIKNVSISGIIIAVLATVGIMNWRYLSTLKQNLFTLNSRIESHFSFLCCWLPFLFFRLDIPNHDSIIYHLGAYLGPTGANLAGGIPMVDVHGQYGLSYLVFSLVFKFFLPVSVFSIGLVAQTLDILQQVILLLIVREASGKRLQWTVLSIITILFINLFVVSARFGLPSVGGFRFLPPLIFIYALTRLKQEARTFSIFSVISFLCSCFWSLETFFFTFFTYVLFIFSQNIFLEKRTCKIRRLCLNILTLLGIFLSAVSLFSIGIYLVSGFLPDIRPIWEIVILSHVRGITGRPAETGFDPGWSTPVDSHYAVWVIFFIVYFLILCYVLRLFIDLRRPAFSRPTLVYIYLPLATLGILELTYFVGRSDWQNLVSASYPFSTLLMILTIQVLKNMNSVPSRKFPFQLAIPTFVILFFVNFFAIGALSFENDYRKSINYSVINLVYKQGFKGLIRTLDTGINTPLASMPEKTHIYSPRETYDMIVKWSPQEKRILLLIDDFAAPLALLYAGKTQKYPISNWINDLQSPTLVRKIYDFEPSLKQGEKVYIPSKKSDFHEKDLPILKKVLQAYDLCPVDKGSYVRVLELSKKSHYEGCASSMTDLWERD